MKQPLLTTEYELKQNGLNSHKQHGTSENDILDTFPALAPKKF